MLPIVARAGVDAQVRAIVHAADLRQAQVSLFAADAATGDVLFDMDGDEPLIPASNMKLITSAAALRVLGPDFVFKTELKLLDPAADAAVLCVKGDGDPAFGDPKLLAEHGYDVDQLLAAWVAVTRNAGVRKVKQLIVDDRVFDRELVHPDWPTNQLHKWYCAQVAGLNFQDNCFDIYVKPTKRGRSPIITIRPDSPFIETSNRAVTGKADTFWAARKLGSNTLIFHNQAKHERVTPVHVTIHDPPTYFGRLLAHRLDQAGVEEMSVRLAEPDERLAQGRVLHRHQSTMPVVLGRCNKDSQNLFGEALMKRMGHEATGTPGSWPNGAAALRRFLHERLGPRGAGVAIADGSGMSRNNRVPARLLVDLLVAMHQDPTLGPVYRESLSVAGHDGTLRKRFGRTMTAQVYGKSGYINRVCTLSGYLVFEATDETPSRTIAFSLLFNEFKPPVYLHTIKQVQDQIVQLLDRVAAPRNAVQMGG